MLPHAPVACGTPARIMIPDPIAGRPPARQRREKRIGHSRNDSSDGVSDLTKGIKRVI